MTTEASDREPVWEDEAIPAEWSKVRKKREKEISPGDKNEKE